MGWEKWQGELIGGPQGGRDRGSCTDGRGFLGELSFGGTSVTEFRFVLEENTGRARCWGSLWKSGVNKRGWELAWGWGQGRGMSSVSLVLLIKALPNLVVCDTGNFLSSFIHFYLIQGLEPFVGFCWFEAKHIPFSTSSIFHLVCNFNFTIILSIFYPLFKREWQKCLHT